MKKRKPMKQETKQKIRESNTGLKRTKETRQKNREVAMGNKNMLGRHHSIQSRLQMSKTKKGKISSFKGKHFTDEQKQKLSIAHSGQIPWNKGKKSTIETRRKLREYSVAHPNRKFKDTTIELKIEAELQKRGITYEKQVPLCKIAIVDFYLPEYHIVIQCDGCYWHNCLIHFPSFYIGRQERDAKQDAVLTYYGFNVFRFWEHDINESSEKCINKIGV